MGARGTVGLVSLAFLAGLTATALFTSTAAAQVVRDQVLPGCGICYPGGYDVNTVGEVSGTIDSLQEPAAGPVRFFVAGERERWVVLAAPAWFWKNANLHLASGDAVTVRGSKTLGADGKLYLVAREIRPGADEPAIVLRDRLGTPLWDSGHRGDRIAGGTGDDCRGQGSGRGRNGGSGRR